MKAKTILSLLLLICFTACNRGTFDFSYSPESPRAGEAVVFNNLSTKGDKWAWQFGDGSTSILKYPTHTYLKPGVYTITMMTDSSKHKTCAKEITVYDTIPSVFVSSDSILYMQKVTLRALYYNPYSKKVTFSWHLPESAVIIDGGLTEESVDVYFDEPNSKAEIGLTVVLDGVTTEIRQTLDIHDNRAHGLVVARRDEQQLTIERLRIFDTGISLPLTLSRQENANGSFSTLAIKGNTLFMFAQNSSSSLYSLDLSQTNNTHSLIEGDNAVSCGTIDNGYLYWHRGGNAIYRFALPMQTISADAATAFATNNQHNLSGDIAVYRNRIIYAGSDSIYIAPLPETEGAQFAGKGIRRASDIGQLCVDAIGQKIYTIENSSLWVSNLDGSYPYKYEDFEATAITIAPERGVLFVANADGIFELPLTHNPQNIITDEPHNVSVAENVTALAYDPVER
ncbi:MAG: PKD domain-containing protein [Paludibacteraceae bacterium]|nr:PKD domain-containing protein [Paludibacteraceae bacterium]